MYRFLRDKSQYGAGDKEVVIVQQGDPTILRIEDFGAVGDGVTDDAAAFQAAINALPERGGRIELLAKTYAIGSRIWVGTGTVSNISSRNGIHIIGRGAGTGDAESIPNTITTTLKWVGSSQSGWELLNVMGPIYGVEISGIRFDCNNLLGGAIYGQHISASKLSDISCTKWTGSAYWFDAFPAPPPGCVTGSNSVVVERMRCIGPSSGINAGGLILGSTTWGSSPHVDIAGWVFIKCDWQWANSGAGILLNFVDNVSWYQCTSFRGSGSGGFALQIAPPTGNTGDWPADCAFYSCALGGDIFVNGATPSWAPIAKILFIPWNSGDNPNYPTNAGFTGMTTKGEWFGALAPTAGSSVIGRARLTSDASGSGFRKVGLSTADTDVGGANFSSGSSRFTPTVAGYYLCTGAVLFSGVQTTPNGGVNVMLYKNGSRAHDGDLQQNFDTSTQASIACNVTAVIYCNGSTDYIELYAWSSSLCWLVGSQTYYTYLHIAKVG